MSDVMSHKRQDTRGRHSKANVHASDSRQQSKPFLMACAATKPHKEVNPSATTARASLYTASAVIGSQH